MALLPVSRRNCRATVERPPDRDGYTPTSEDWKPVLDGIWVAVFPLVADERYVDPGYGGFATHRVEACYSSLVKRDMRLVYGNRKLHIAGVINVDERGIDMILMCQEIV